MSAASATTAFDEALISFKEGLTDTEKLDFAQTTIDDVLKAAKKIQEKQGKRALLRNLNRIKPYIDGLIQFSRVIEVFVQVKPEIMAFIWVCIHLAHAYPTWLCYTLMAALGSDQIFAPGIYGPVGMDECPNQDLIRSFRLPVHTPIALTG